ncbi:hypothetical protein NDI76_03240 [Halogeometricum sp. S1BR25-6]|uniref:DUF11 domain-containing protein n=1 Tax=Halogeometricum salsisoli TaxID=2950536 RepID=A0ABU2GAA8_9EURY|nr:hypothetical protein [Halogeometricum sp. S1BR25-6]MDS0297753.1 hypothetical protein [Halogeometricum sp. S1BR25-6]
MHRSLALGVALLLVASGVGGVASVAAASPAPSSDDSTLAAQQAPRQPGGTNAAAAKRNDDQQFDFDLVRTSNCGVACRDVTVRVTNIGDEPVRNVRVNSRLKAGNSVIWRGNDAARTLKPGESKTVTKRVRLGPLDAYRVQRNGGSVAAVTTVAWNGGSETFTERRKVA